MSHWAIAVIRVDDKGIGHEVVAVEERTWPIALEAVRKSLLEIAACNCPHDYAPNGFGASGAHNAFCASVMLG